MTNIRRISEKGLGRLERSFNQLLYHSYGFDTWHIANGSRNRPYKKLLAAQINDLEGKLGLAVEIGCGLGDILVKSMLERKSDAILMLPPSAPQGYEMFSEISSSGPVTINVLRNRRSTPLSQ